MSELMLSYLDINWSEIVMSTESPIDFCLRKDVPAYFRMKKGHRVRYGYQLAGYIVEGFDDRLEYLRLDKSSLKNIATSGLSPESSFSDHGIFLDESVVEMLREGDGELIEKREDVHRFFIEKVRFNDAFLIDREKWKSVPLIPSVESSHAPMAFEILVDVRKGDLWFAASDIDLLRQEAKRERELVKYPFGHEEQMPGIYWMYQAAYVHNRLGSITTKDSSVERLKDIEKWLLGNNGSAFPSRSIRSAKKFVPLQHDRKRGKSRKEFVPEVFVSEVGDGSNLLKVYTPDFVGKGLSCILSIADWWERYYQGAKEDRLKLAVQLDASGFDGLELGDLVHLISGKPLSVENILAFEAHLTQQGRDHKPFDFVDKEKRPKPSSAKR